MPADPRKHRERYELRRITDEDTLNKAFQLAHSIYRYRRRDRKIAFDILTEALEAVELRLMAQDEADRHEPQKPTKVRWSTSQWFQFLIYVKSERYEKEQESGSLALITETDMVIRYIKHLVLIGGRRNSFHVTLGLSRLLYDYSTPETMALYDLVFQDPDSSTKKADAYYRDRKIRLIEELQKRFHRFVKLDPGPRGENRFETQQDSTQFTDLINQYLKLFTPWETTCVFPGHLSEWSTIPDLQFNQVSQIHSVIHPTCFFNLTKALRLDPPRIRLAVPRFFLESGPDEETAPHGDSSNLTQKEIGAIRKKLDEEGERRKKSSPLFLLVMIDGVERARLDLTQSREIRLEVEEGATLMQFVGRDRRGEFLLGTHILRYEDAAGAEQSRAYSVVLEGGQKISLAVLPAPSGADDSHTTVNITFSETKWARNVWLWLARARDKESYSTDLKRPWDLAPLAFKVALVVLSAGLVGLVLYFTLKGIPTQQSQIAREEPPPPIVDQGRPGSNPGPGVDSSGKAPVKQPGARASSGSREQSGGGTRDQVTNAVRSLANVKRVYVESFGDDEFRRGVRTALVEKLRNTGRFVVTENKNEADTAVSGTVRQREGEEGTGHITVELVNAAGDVIWAARRYGGTPEHLGSQFTKDLLDAIRRDEGKAKRQK